MSSNGVSPGTQEGVYCVAWICPKCGNGSLEICPFGPLVPEHGICLNCGEADLKKGSCCRSCGMDESEFTSLASTSNSPIETASEMIQRGLSRRALAVLNFALADDKSLANAWHMKCTLLDQLGHRKLKLELLRSALSAGAPPTFLTVNVESLIENRCFDDAQACITVGLELVKDEKHLQDLLEQRSWIYAETGNGESALKSATQATKQYPDSTRAHYLRGRALALLGRMDEARTAMELVISMPDTTFDSDAEKGLKMINEFKSANEKPWWRFW